MEQQNTKLALEDELKNLREKTEQNAIVDELKKGLLGGFKQKDVIDYIKALRLGWQRAEEMYNSHIAELVREKDTLKREKEAKLREEETLLSEEGENLPFLVERLREEVASLTQRLEVAETEKQEAVQKLSNDEGIIAGQEERNMSLHRDVLEFKEQLMAREMVAQEFQAQLLVEKETVRQLQSENTQVKTACESANEQLRIVGEQLKQAQSYTQSLKHQLETEEKRLIALIKDHAKLEVSLIEAVEKGKDLSLERTLLLKEKERLVTELGEQRSVVGQYHLLHERLLSLGQMAETVNGMMEGKISDMQKAMEELTESILTETKVAVRQLSEKLTHSAIKEAEAFGSHTQQYTRNFGEQFYKIKEQLEALKPVVAKEEKEIESVPSVEEKGQDIAVIDEKTVE